MRKAIIFGSMFVFMMGLLMTAGSSVQPTRANASCILPTQEPGFAHNITLTQSSAVSFYGSNVTFTVTPQNGTWGSTAAYILFVDELKPIGRVSLPSLGKNPVTFTTNTLTVGDHTIWAFYETEACGSDGTAYDGRDSLNTTHVDHNVLYKVSVGF